MPLPAIQRRFIRSLANKAVVLAAVSAVFCPTCALPAPKPIERTAWYRLVESASPLESNACKVSWRDARLAEAMRRLQQTCGVTVWIDRRLDPGTLLDTPSSAANQELAASMAAFCRDREWGSAVIGEVVYLGPAETARTLPTRLANRLEQIKTLPPRQQRTLQQSSALEWPKLSEPRPLIESLLDGRGLGVEGGDLIPHDRWAANRLPAMPLCDQLTLLLAGFELDWSPASGGRSIRIQPVRKPQPVAASYRLTGREKSLYELRERLEEGERLSTKGARVQLTASVDRHRELHRRLNKPQAARQNPPASSDRWRDERYTLTVKDQPAEALLRQLAKQIGLRVEIAPAASDRMASAGRIGLEVRGATLDELLQELARQAGIVITREGGLLKVTPASR